MSNLFLQEKLQLSKQALIEIEKNLNVQESDLTTIFSYILRFYGLDPQLILAVCNSAILGCHSISSLRDASVSDPGMIQRLVDSGVLLRRTAMSDEGDFLQYGVNQIWFDYVRAEEVVFNTTASQNRDRLLSLIKSNWHDPLNSYFIGFCLGLSPSAWRQPLFEGLCQEMSQNLYRYMPIAFILKAICLNEMSEPLTKETVTEVAAYFSRWINTPHVISQPLLNLWLGCFRLSPYFQAFLNVEQIPRCDWTTQMLRYWHVAFRGEPRLKLMQNKHPYTLDLLEHDSVLSKKEQDLLFTYFFRETENVLEPRKFALECYIRAKYLPISQKTSPGNISSNYLVLMSLLLNEIKTLLAEMRMAATQNTKNTYLSNCLKYFIMLLQNLPEAQQSIWFPIIKNLLREENGSYIFLNRLNILVKTVNEPGNDALKKHFTPELLHKIRNMDWTSSVSLPLPRRSQLTAFTKEEHDQLITFFRGIYIKASESHQFSENSLIKLNTLFIPFSSFDGPSINLFDSFSEQILQYLQDVRQGTAQPTLSRAIINLANTAPDFAFYYAAAGFTEPTAVHGVATLMINQLKHLLPHVIINRKKIEKLLEILESLKKFHHFKAAFRSLLKPSKNTPFYNVLCLSIVNNSLETVIPYLNSTQTKLENVATRLALPRTFTIADSLELNKSLKENENIITILRLLQKPLSHILKSSEQSIDAHALHPTIPIIIAFVRYLNLTRFKNFISIFFDSSHLPIAFIQALESALSSAGLAFNNEQQSNQFLLLSSIKIYKVKFSRADRFNFETHHQHEPIATLGEMVVAIHADYPRLLTSTILTEILKRPEQVKIPYLILLKEVMDHQRFMIPPNILTQEQLFVMLRDSKQHQNDWLKSTISPNCNWRDVLVYFAVLTFPLEYMKDYTSKWEVFAKYWPSVLSISPSIALKRTDGFLAELRIQLVNQVKLLHPTSSFHEKIYFYIVTIFLAIETVSKTNPQDLAVSTVKLLCERLPSLREPEPDTYTTTLPSTFSARQFIYFKLHISHLTRHIQHLKDEYKVELDLLHSELQAEEEKMSRCHTKYLLLADLVQMDEKTDAEPAAKRTRLDDMNQPIDNMIAQEQAEYEKLKAGTERLKQNIHCVQEKYDIAITTFESILKNMQTTAEEFESRSRPSVIAQSPASFWDAPPHSVTDPAPSQNLRLGATA